jgi:hypothetical protein
MIDPDPESMNADQKLCFKISSFLFHVCTVLWVIFAFLDPDPQTQLHLDPDLQHWSYTGAGKDSL